MRDLNKTIDYIERGMLLGIAADNRGCAETVAGASGQALCATAGAEETTGRAEMGWAEMGGLGSGDWKKREHKMVGSCAELDATYLSARGSLQSGVSSTYPWTLGNAIVPLDLHAQVFWGRGVFCTCTPASLVISLIGNRFSGFWR